MLIYIINKMDFVRHLPFSSHYVLLNKKKEEYLVEDGFDLNRYALDLLNYFHTVLKWKWRYDSDKLFLYPLNYKYSRQVLHINLPIYYNEICTEEEWKMIVKVMFDSFKPTWKIKNVHFHNREFI